MCYGKVLAGLSEDLKSKFKKTCLVKEFKTVPIFSSTSFEALMVAYCFQSPKSTMNVWSVSELVKTVNKEYLIVSWMSLVGNVGGTLGMFVGFSFIGTTEWLMTSFVPFWKQKNQSIRK